MSGDGAFSSRRRTGEGLLPFANHLVRLKLRIRYSLPLPLRRNPTAAQNATPSSLRDRRRKAKIRKAEEQVKWQIANVKSQRYARSLLLQFAFCVLTFDLLC